MSKRIILKKLAQKVEESKGVSSSTKSPPTAKGVVIWEKCLKDEVSNILPREVKSNGKVTLPLLNAKKAKSSMTSSAPAIKGAKPIMAPGKGTLANPGTALRLEASMLGNPSMAEKILVGIILPDDKEKAVVLGSSLTVRKLEGLLTEFGEQEQKATKKLKEKIEAVARLEAEVAELKKNEALTKGKAIKEYKSLNDFQEAVKSVAFKYFGEGFDFYKRQLAQHHPNLSIDLDGMGLDHDLLKEEDEEEEETGEDK
ncbi:hypothetical protein Acr_00g0026490 [Actinidia rufa]|uniref:Uncharacterized protein n=1 Tax=Actinidia rufa TaxID=165716 RepID=A0A7J0DDN1_9ERIC|nr:hypothetical protein Acr_00g0026490 [Actinidia rufa]